MCGRYRKWKCCKFQYQTLINGSSNKENMFTTITITKCMNILYWISSSSFRIRHNNKGGYAPWYLESVTIEDTETEIKSVLPANCWLDKKRTSLETTLYLKGILVFFNHLICLLSVNCILYSTVNFTTNIWIHARFIQLEFVQGGLWTR